MSRVFRVIISGAMLTPVSQQVGVWRLMRLFKKHEYAQAFASWSTR